VVDLHPLRTHVTRLGDLERPRVIFDKRVRIVSV
jgi:hypothetical protein